MARPNNPNVTRFELPKEPAMKWAQEQADIARAILAAPLRTIADSPAIVARIERLKEKGVYSGSAAA